jgi:hypothetical protein
MGSEEYPGVKRRRVLKSAGAATAGTVTTMGFSGNAVAEDHNISDSNWEEWEDYVG